MPTSLDPRRRAAAPLDAASPVPIYHQIASALRERIESGSLPAGSTLEPMREAAQRLGVNVHTVRHAYAELARKGLVETRRALGTRVLGRQRSRRNRSGRSGDLRGFLAEVARRAQSEFGLTRSELAERLDQWAAGEAPPAVHVVECSQAQCEDLVGQLVSRFACDARPWPLEKGEPPAGEILATYFHYNEIRTRWPDRLDSIRFATIRPERELARHLRKRRRGAGKITVTLCELDAPTLEAVAADLSVILPPGGFVLRQRLVQDPVDALSGRGRSPVLLPPRVWSRLSVEQRSDPRVFQVRYVFDPDELETIGAELSLDKSRAPSPT